MVGVGPESRAARPPAATRTQKGRRWSMLSTYAHVAQERGLFSTDLPEEARPGDPDDALPAVVRNSLWRSRPLDTAGDGMPDGSPSSEERPGNGDGLLSDEPTVELIARARTGDTAAVEALMQRCLPALKRWAHGRLPSFARSYMDTGDLVQEAALNTIRHLDTFEPRRVGAMQAYLVQCVINRIRDEVRRVGRHGLTSELPENTPAGDQSPLELAIAAQAYERYRDALKALKSRDRQIAVARIELQWTAGEIAERFRFRTRDGARMATARALERLGAELHITTDGQLP